MSEWDAFPLAKGDGWDAFPIASQPSVAGDVATQLATHAGQFIEQAPGIGPSLMNLAGKGVDWLANKVAPGNAKVQEMQDVARQRAEFMEANKPPMLINPPKAETVPGEYAATAGDLLGLAMGRGRTIPQRAAAVAVPTVTGETAQQVTGDPIAKMIATLGGAAVTAKVQAGQAERAARKTVPSGAASKEAAVDEYNALRAGHVEQPIAQSELDSLADDLSKTVNKIGPRPSVAPGGHAAINEIRTPANAGAPDVADLVAARQNLKDFFSNPLPDKNKAVAAIAIPKIDAAIERLSPGTMERLRAADKNYSVGMTSERLDKRVARAEMRAAGEHSGMNLGNKLRQNAATMLLSNKESRGLTGADKSALETMNRGTFSQNAMRLGSNLLGGGGGLGSTFLGLGLGGAGYATGNPEAAALPFVGLGLRGMYNRSVANQAANISAQIRARSPYAQANMAPPKTKPSQLEMNLLALALAQRGLLPSN